MSDAQSFDPGCVDKILQLHTQHIEPSLLAWLCGEGEERYPLAVMPVPHGVLVRLVELDHLLEDGERERATDLLNMREALEIEHLLITDDGWKFDPNNDDYFTFNIYPRGT